MTSFLFANLPIIPKPSVSSDTPIEHSNSTETLIKQKHSTSSSSDLSTLSSDDSTNNGMPLSETPVRTEIYVKFKENEAEFFAYNPSKISLKSCETKSMRKRDRIRFAFKKKFHRSKSHSSDTDSEEWTEMLAKTLTNMYEDIQDIVDGFDQMEKPINEQSQIDSIRFNSRFRQHQLQKFEMIRMITMLHPPNLLTYHSNESPFAYTNIIEPNNLSILRLIKQVPDEHLLIQGKPHRKIRYRMQRILIKMKDNIEKLKYDYYGHQSVNSIEELSSLNVQNYRNRLEKNLIDFRRQMEEYDQIHSSREQSQKSISQIFASTKIVDPEVQTQVDDYRSKLRPIQYVDKRPRNSLISAPYIARRVHCHHHHHQQQQQLQKTIACIDTRFDPTTFVDLVQQADEFFGPEKPFWDRSRRTRLSVSLLLERSKPNDVILPMQLDLWTRLVRSFRKKQKRLRNTHIKQNDDQDEFFDCSSSLPQTRLQTIVSFDTENSIDI